jgi:hypothetical protein
MSSSHPAGTTKKTETNYEKSDYIILERVNYLLLSVICVIFLVGLLIFICINFFSHRTFTFWFLLPIGFIIFMISGFMQNINDVSNKIIFKKNQIDFWWTFFNKKIKSIYEKEIKNMQIKLKRSYHGSGDATHGYYTYQIDLKITCKNNKKSSINRIHMENIDNIRDYRLLREIAENLHEFCKKNYPFPSQLSMDEFK